VGPAGRIREDIEAAVETTYTLTGAHTHTVTLTAADFRMLAAGETIVVMSSLDVHTHMVTISCA
jgi:hypothetical protein